MAVQRGATGNYIADRVSALDIPEEMPAATALVDQIRAHVYFEKVRADNGGPQAEMVAGWIADGGRRHGRRSLEVGIRLWRDSRLWNRCFGSQGRRVGCIPQEAEGSWAR